MHPEALKATPPRRANPQPLAAASDPDALLNMHTATALAGMSESSLYRHAAAGRLALVRIGPRCTRIRAAELRRFLASLG